MATDIRIRAGVHNLTDQNVADLRSAYGQIQAFSDNRSFQYLAGLHGVPSWYCWHHQGNAHIAQQMELFLPWHRAYLYNFEMGLRDQVPGVTLPWWDWTLRSPQQNGLPTIFTAAKGADGKPKNFCVPCWIKINATTILKMLKKIGAQREANTFSIGPVLPRSA